MEKRRNLERFVSPLGEILPHPSSLKHGWNNDFEKIPDFSNKKLYNYLVLSHGWTVDTEQTNAKRQLEARVFYDEDIHVHSVQYHEIEESNTHCLVRAKVIPSTTLVDKRKPDYVVWISMSKVTGHVHSAGCDCSGAGDGESCNHIATLLYELIDITEEKEEGHHASKSNNCKWNELGNRKLSPKKSQDITLKKCKWTQENPDSEVEETPFKEETVLTVKPINLDNFARKLRQCAPNAAWLLTRPDTVVKKDALYNVALLV